MEKASLYFDYLVSMIIIAWFIRLSARAFESSDFDYGVILLVFCMPAIYLWIRWGISLIIGFIFKLYPEYTFELSFNYLFPWDLKTKQKQEDKRLRLCREIFLEADLRFLVLQIMKGRIDPDELLEKGYITQAQYDNKMGKDE